MFKNYVKVALRHLKRHKVYTLISVLGFAAGMACTLLLFLWVAHEVRYDRGQVNRDDIYRLEREGWAEMRATFGPLASACSEVQSYFRVYHPWRPEYRVGQEVVQIDNFVFADPSIFQVLTLPFKSGDPATALASPFSVVLTQSQAMRLFGDPNPIGKTLLMNDRHRFQVTGVIEDVEDLHLKIGVLANIQDVLTIQDNEAFFELDKWSYLTYLQVHASANVADLEQRVNRLLLDHRLIEKRTLFLRPFTDIYFANDIQHETGVRHGNRRMMVLFAIVALLVFAIACFNFINLSTSRSALRSKEVGLRKVVGAGRKRLFVQFFLESLFIAFGALLLGLLILYLLLPHFNRIAELNLQFRLDNGIHLLGIVLLFCMTGVLAGGYPAVFFSRLRPTVLFRGVSDRGYSAVQMRNVFVIMQFVVSVFLFVAMLGILRQIHFMQNSDLGFDLSRMVNLKLTGALQEEKKEVFRERLDGHPDISRVTFSNQPPGQLTNTNTWGVQGEEKPMTVVNTDPDYFECMGLILIEGRPLMWDRPSDNGLNYVINQEAVCYLGLENPVGQVVRANFGQGRIVGVVKDYHFNSLHHRIQPIAIGWYEAWANMAHIKISGPHVSEALQFIEEVWQELNPSYPFVYTFMDDSFAEQYRLENRMADLLKVFVGFIVLLTGMGLLGLSAFNAERRYKEIAVRKVLGASSLRIVLLLLKGISKGLVLANAIAWPLSYFFLKDWMARFAYRMPLSPVLFIGSGLAVMLIAWTTVSYHTFKAARLNPVQSLRQI